jgi:hypothetical protein
VFQVDAIVPQYLLTLTRKDGKTGGGLGTCAAEIILQATGQVVSAKTALNRIPAVEK